MREGGIMSSDNKAGATPAHVAGIATQTGVLDSTEGLSLIGLFGPDSGLNALVRERGGRIHQVKAGGKVGGARILAIDAEGVMVQTNGRTWRLGLPAG
jgi:hypothetical protein